ncbi:hypothetical protein SERLA73DRAFT_190357 [Serpula lacrymans var. lacrymans S7.3]|uniref:Protein kinase domain-containing protein n=2 Tax=Serpula lacrymans var. lacrymans TaxID=341189 RepID=F8QFJ5_SERL3|nr:uncharacterized protein SERLADRAFT_479405 [Serpula lacrymans var. lacrymans S7.9]EGN92979.1 hypothetical protein SERLA73DRAFT_190357 [Serpula lacrymans var. lacrymans S7.3]EGO19691.1 hypothetical protein SERLADRAFT_479405 [Serpula lacrymans var. lacrymans S7.9]
MPSSPDQRKLGKAKLADAQADTAAKGSSNEAPKAGRGALRDDELWWCSHFQWLMERGYLLRPRYAPGWVPSWQNTKKFWYNCEDGRTPWYPHLLDATRIADGSYVSLKVIVKSRHPFEADIGRYFSSGQLVKDPANHCVPIYEVIEVPKEQDKIMLVMPLLREYDDPPFDTFGEAVDCFRQIFEGLQFMHKHHVAHRDCMNLNIMMDPTSFYIDAYHPFDPCMRRDFKGEARHRTRTQRPPKYFFIDFGISRRYDPTDEQPLEDPIWGGDKTVPEFQRSNEPQNPFYTDVYYLGNVIREDFIQGKFGFEFMIPLVADMVQDDPAKRPSMDEVVIRFEKLRQELSTWKLRSRVIDKENDDTMGFFGGLTHWTRRVSFMIRRIPPVPIP